MKLFFLITLLSITIVTNGQQQSQGIFKITTFKNVPKDMEGCGENFFFNKQDERAERFVLYTDYNRALICLNSKIISISGNDKPPTENRIFSNKDYTLIIQYGKIRNTGDESYEIKSAIITLKYHSKVVWTQNVIGGGGC